MNDNLTLPELLCCIAKVCNSKMRDKYYLSGKANDYMLKACGTNEYRYSVIFSRNEIKIDQQILLHGVFRDIAKNCGWDYEVTRVEGDDDGNTVVSDGLYWYHYWFNDAPDGEEPLYCLYNGAAYTSDILTVNAIAVWQIMHEKFGHEYCRQIEVQP